ncbi:MAG: TipC family immunity protein, partial [Ruminococcus flavefaciens]|nr:TipC family immunity protein [Ruminococcus flavefaciens]
MMEDSCTEFLKSKSFKKMMRILNIYLIISFIISCFTPNVMSQIGRWQIYGTNFVSEIEKFTPEWEWPGALNTFGALSVDYKEEYLRGDVCSVSLHFRDNSNDVCIRVEVSLSGLNEVTMISEVEYDYEEKKLTYEPVYIIVEEESTDIEVYRDEKSVTEYLDKYGLTKRD